MVKLLKQSSQVARAIVMLFDDFVPLITSQVLGCEVSKVLHTNIERNKVVIATVGIDLKLLGPQAE